MKRLLIFGLMSFAAVSCMIGEPATCNSFILGYYSIPDITVAQSEYVSTSGGSYVHLTLDHDRINRLSSVFHDFKEDNGLYDEYCKLHHDTNYTSRLVHSLTSSPWAHCSYPASNFTEISVTYMDDWDESHPSGSSLGDITTMVAVSIYPFIESGYTEYDYDLVDQPELFNAVYPFKKGYEKNQWYPTTQIIDELSTEDLALLGTGSRLGDYPQICDLFIPKRDSGSPCTLRISMTNTDGVVYNSEVTVQ